MSGMARAEAGQSPTTVVVPRDGRQVALRPGEAVTFGRDDPDDPDNAAHLGLSANPRLHLLAGRIEVDDTGWVLTNLGRWLHLRVVEIDGPNRLDLHPGRAVRVPYPRCLVEAATGDETVAIEVDCPRLAAAGSGTGAGDGEVPLSGATVGGLGLDRGAGYFLALVALCAPRLRDPQSDEVATVGQIVQMLNARPGATERVTAKAIERRLAHVRHKIGLATSDPYSGSAAGLEVRDAARQLADVVLRTGTVTAADLELLHAEAATP